MSWNYRVIRQVHESEEELSIYEVYYTGSKPTSRSKDPVPFSGTDLADLGVVLGLALEALDKPILDLDLKEV